MLLWVCGKNEINVLMYSQQQIFSFLLHSGFFALILQNHMTYWAGLIASLKPICFFPMLLSVPADFCVLMCFRIAMVWCCQDKYNCLFDFFFFNTVKILILVVLSFPGRKGSTNIHTHMEIHTYPSQVLSHWANPAAWLRSHSWRQRRSFANQSLTAELLEQWLTK